MIRELWYLPRPRQVNKYRGGFPLHFEKRLFNTYRPSRILQPFGGKAEYGIRLDIKNVVQGEDIKPDIIADAHRLPFRNNSFDFVLCDPPYSDEESSRLFGTGHINTKAFVAEAVRVTRIGGYVALYHRRMNSRPKGTIYDRIIVVLTRVNHSPRVCCVFQRVKTLFDGEVA